MPIYTLKCLRCGKEEDIVCMVKERNNIRCRCGGKMRVKIGRTNFICRNVNLKVGKWMKERGL